MIFLAIIIIVKLYFIILSFFPRGKEQTDDPYAEIRGIADDVRSTINFYADPCEDFYEFACGGFVNNFKLKPTQSRFTRSFTAISEENDKIINEIIKNSADGSLVKNLFQSCMDEAELDRLGVQPIQPVLNTIDIMLTPGATPDKYAEIISYFHRSAMYPLFSLLATADPGQPKNQIGWVRASGSFPLPQSFYKDSDKMKDYEEHIDKIFELLNGHSNNEGEMVVEIESYLAEKAPTPTDLRNPFDIYHPKTITELKVVAPAFDWDTYFDTMQVTKANYVTIDSLTYINNATNFLLKDVSIEHVKTYLKWILLRQMSSGLSKPFRDAHFEYFGKKLSGKQEQEDRETICVKSVGQYGLLGFEVGKGFVEKKFEEANKNQVFSMLEDVKLSFGEILDELDWMDETTLSEAKLKLNGIEDMIGYPKPEEYPDFSGITITPERWIQNKMTLYTFHERKMLDQIGGITDKGQWEMTPQEVNAYYEPTLNEMCFPAGILQYPFFHPKFPLAMNYGGVGSVIGHELSHAFDDEGSQYDSLGYLRMWWSQETREKFQKKANCIRTQYSNFSPLEDHSMYVNGNLTSGENIADNAGVKDAYRALEKSIGETEMKSKSKFLKEFTNEQLFFISFAQIWCTKQTKELTIQRLLTDPHSPPQFRVIGTLSNNPQFSDAFQCSLGSKMNPKKKCSLF